MANLLHSINYMLALQQAFFQQWIYAREYIEHTLNITPDLMKSVQLRKYQRFNEISRNVVSAPAQRNSTGALSLPGKFGRQTGITHDPVKTHDGNLMQDGISGLFDEYGNDSTSSLAQGNEDDSKKGSSIH
ncbi:hypothetical protein R1flu_025607 [Riccia fluitans]|uniref:Uncharacterized protein n=1 Tax=Riccia fluitans TaxID=41844 RepID=A0ABD1XYL5_9MARC